MNNKIYTPIVCGLILLFSLTLSCKKDKPAPIPEPPVTSVTDADGNVYQVVTIGTQTWMAENLRTTKLKDGTQILPVTDNTVWSNTATPAYCWYNNDMVNATPYGALYNWYTINSGKLAPIGWHIPTAAEWQTLADYLGGDALAGGKLKEVGTTHFASPNAGATNETGFTAVGSGYRSSDGIFFELNNAGRWWRATDGVTVQTRWVNSTGSILLSDAGLNKKNGYSVRCIKD
jgi:uncharacterized protein (TIGR02145 family)